MADIAVLPQLLVNKIAAGEVVERPASVLKELLENALDAHARRIDVELEDGGRKLVQVTDAGHGIDPDQLTLAFAPHATSKIVREDDLYAIATLGFRGEALASIGSVSQVEALSRTPDAVAGARLAVRGGEFEGPAPAAAPPGTAIAVRNLFFNTPARRKFLRTANTELGHCTECFTRIALAHPAVHFTLTHNGRSLYELPADQSLRERIGQLFSPDLANDLLPVSRKDPGIESTGLIAPPRHSRSNPQWQYFFLNGRYIRDRFIAHALREAYRGLLDNNRQPIAFLFLTLPPDQVDVNVHPAKSEVRFADSNRIHSHVLAAIRDRLLSTDLAVPLQRPAGSDNSQPALPDDDDLAPTETSDERRERVRQAMADFFKSAPPPQPRLDFPTNRPSQHSGTPSVSAGPPIPTHAPVPPESPVPTHTHLPPEPRPAPAETAPDDHQPLLPSRFVQLHNAYLVTETDEGVLIIDQHALHERILYERLHDQAARGPLPSQRCLIPETIDVTDRQLAAAENAAELLHELGIFLEPFGPRILAVQGFPALLENASPTDFVRDLLDLLAAETGQVTREALLGELLEMIACKAAVKAGDPLSDQEIAALLAQRKNVERTSNCPHGRPTTLSLTLTQLEKQFKRT